MILKYKGAYAITPNFKEFQDVVGKAVESEDQVKRHAQELCKQLELEWLIITRSEKGMSLVNQAGDKIDIPTRAKEVTDITGAGDTVIAGLSLGLAAGLEIEVAAQLANFAAGVSVSKVGTVSVQYDDVLTAIKRQNHESS